MYPESIRNAPKLHQDSRGAPVTPGDLLVDSLDASLSPVQVVRLHGAGQFVYLSETGAELTSFCCCFTICPPPAPQSPGDSLAAPAAAGQGVCTLPAIEQFQRWMETEAHTAHRRYLHGCRTAPHRIAHLRAAMALLLDFKDQA